MLFPHSHVFSPQSGIFPFAHRQKQKQKQTQDGDVKRSRILLYNVSLLGTFLCCITTQCLLCEVQNTKQKKVSIVDASCSSTLTHLSYKTRAAALHSLSSTRLSSIFYLFQPPLAPPPPSLPPPIHPFSSQSLPLTSALV